MEKSAILNKYSNDGDKLFISKILDKIKLAKTRNQIVNTDFLDMYQKKISTEILKTEKELISCQLCYPEKRNCIDMTL